MRFRYSSIDASGKRVRGQVEALTEEDARAYIVNSGELLVDLAPQHHRTWFKLETQSEISLETAARFALELSGLIEAGAPLRKALDIQTDGQGKVSALAKGAIKQIDIGGSLSSALRQSGGAAVLLSEFVAAGEAGAGLDRMLGTGGRFLHARAEAFARIRSALAYPMFICLLAFAALTVMTLYVAPSLAPLVEDVDGGGAIQVLSDIGQWVQANSAAILFVTAISVGILFLLAKTDRVSKQLVKLSWAMPVIGSIRKDLDISQACEVLSTLLESGRSMESALSFAGAASSQHVARLFGEIAEHIRDGEVASVAFSAASDLPNDVRRLAVLGESTSAFPHAMKQAGEICHARAMRKLDRLAALAGPVLVIGMGGMIAALMLTVLGSLGSLGGEAL